MPYLRRLKFDPHKYDTKIICTLGPSSNSEDVINKMAQAGMVIARLNFSHGDHQQHQKMINVIRAVNKKHGHGIKILQDLSGYRIRIGNLKKSVKLEHKQIVYMVKGTSSEDDTIPLDAEFDVDALTKGMEVYIADGTMSLKVLGQSGKKIKLEVLHGGNLTSRKGVNIPKLKLQANILTDKDKEDIEFGIKNEVDYVALSFVRNRQDVSRAAKLIQERRPDCKIIAKIENREGVKNIESIIEISDGILVARGDLGVSLPIYQIPVIQKEIIRRCNRKKKIVITATQMLESMIKSSRPTRAEVSDVANAIFDGSDYVMLSGETAIGQYVVRTVWMMTHIIQYTEKFIYRL